MRLIVEQRSSHAAGADLPTTEVRASGGSQEVTDTEEQRLLAACRRGDPGALRRLVELHYDPLYRFLWRLTASPEAAADLTQEAFVRALERLASFDGRSRFSTWLHSIALNVWKDTCRRGGREIGITDERALDAAADVDSEQEAMARLERHEVRRAVERLPEAQRVAILLFFYQGMSYQEIAHICDCPVGTVGSWIHHGIRSLRGLLCEERQAGRSLPSWCRLPGRPRCELKE
jgi:RNA polymerase sigma-70 factor, ECF subfamily